MVYCSGWSGRCLRDRGWTRNDNRGSGSSSLRSSGLVNRIEFAGKVVGQQQKRDGLEGVCLEVFLEEAPITLVF